MEIDGAYYCSRCTRKMENAGLCPFCGYDEENKPTQTVELEEGTLLNGRYQLGCMIGHGGFGLTYVAWDYVLSTPVAVKEYFPRGLVTRAPTEADAVFYTPEDFPAYQVGLRRFVREAQILASLQSVPGTVAVHDYFEDNKTAYIVMEFIRGTPLGEYGALHKMNPTELFTLLREPVETLVAIHRQGVLHRDISPGNLIVLEDGNTKLIDFGAAATLVRHTQGQDQTIVIHEGYAALEQYAADGEQGPWTDVYGLSATLYALLTGTPPVEARLRQAGTPLPTLRQKGVKLPRWQEKAIEDGLTLSPQRRTRSMDEFRCRLYHLPMPEEIQRQKQFISKVVLIASVLLMVLLMGTANFLWGYPLGGGLRYSLRGNGLRVMAYHGTGQSVTIPATRAGFTVTEIGEGAFSHSPTLTTVTVPSTVTQIEALAFHDCSALLTVALSEGTQTIGEYAFAECPSLQTALLPQSAQMIADNAFAGASDGFSVHGIRESMAENYCANHAIPFICEAEYTYVKQGDGVAITTCSATLDNLVLPNTLAGEPITTLMGMGDSDTPWFSQTLQSIALPEALRTLPNGALAGYTKLWDVRFGSRLVRIGDRALADTAIRSVALPVGLQSIGDQAFRASYLQSIALPNGLTHIGAEAFAQTQITEAILPASLQTLGKKAFGYCLSLVSATLPARIAEVPATCFVGCLALRDVQIAQGVTAIGFQAFADCSALRFIALPAGLTTIGRYAFYDCSNLLLVQIPPSVTSISDTAFIGCPVELTVVGVKGSYAQTYADYMGYRFEDEDAWHTELTASQTAQAYGIQVLAAPVAKQTARLPSVVNGRYVAKVYTANELNASDVILPYLAEELSTQAFMGNAAVRQVQVGPTLSAIQSQVFLNCTGLTAINLPLSLTHIGIGAFENCVGLQGITLPQSLRQIQALAFYGCTGLITIDIPRSLTSLEMACFGNTGLVTVTVPGNIAKCVAPFYGCKALETVTFEEGIRNVWCAFSQCARLRTVTLPKSTRQISRATFDGCTALEDVWIYAMDVDLDFKLGSFSIALPEGVVPIEGEGVAIEHLFASCPKVRLHGYAGSTVEAYAQLHNLEFVAIHDDDRSKSKGGLS